jgi:hypothetical protein
VENKIKIYTGTSYELKTKVKFSATKEKKEKNEPYGTDVLVS